MLKNTDTPSVFYPSGKQGVQNRKQTRLLPPGVVDEQFRIDTKLFIEPFLVHDGHLGDITHREDVVPGEAACFAGPDLPEGGQGRMAPEQHPVRHFIQLSDANTVLIWRSLFRYDVHGHLCEIQVGADALRIIRKSTWPTPSPAPVLSSTWAMSSY